MNSVRRLMSSSDSYPTISLDIRVGVDDRSIVDKFSFKDVSGNIVLPEKAIIGQTYTLYSSTDYLLHSTSELGNGVRYFMGEYDSALNNVGEYVDKAVLDSRVRGPHSYISPFVLQPGIFYVYFYRTEGANQTVYSPLTCYVKIKISSPKLRKTSTTIEYVNPLNSGVYRHPLDTEFKYKNSSGGFTSLDNAKIGDTYSLYCETDHATFWVWNSCPGDAVMKLTPYTVGDLDFKLYPHLTHFESDELTRMNRLGPPGPMDYPTKFVLNYGTSYVYIYGTEIDRSVLYNPSTYFVYFKMTTVQSSPEIKKTRTVIEYVNPDNNGVGYTAEIRATVDTVIKLIDLSGSLILPEDAIIGKTYSLSTETDNNIYMVFSNTPGEVAMIEGVYHAVGNSNFQIIPIPTNYYTYDSLSNRTNFLAFPNYPVKFELKFGISYLYLYGTTADITTLNEPSTYFVYYKITTTESL